MRIFLTIAGFAGAVVAQAQTPPPASVPPMSPPSWGTRDPLALPGDNLPPPMQLVIGTSPPINPGAPRTPVASPTLALSIKAAEAAIARCQTEGFAVGVAVSNSVGGLVVAMQAEGAFPGRTYNAVRKNLVAIEFGTPSSSVRAKLRSGDFATVVRTRPNMTLLGGAIPLMADGKIIGAIGVSGAPAGDIDEVCALAGAALLSAKP